ncbi:MFS transporter [Haloechinothrix salitolerans]|uniref:MFS transporter n=1 Tax=Haloechinothrix salitolerans TaxID=926830 RepID=UPI0035E76C7D
MRKAPSSKSMFRSLRHRDYRLFWFGMVISNIGTWMQRVAQDWLVLVVLGGGAEAVGITTGLQFLPFLLVTPFGGLLADRLPKRTLLLATNSFMGATGLTLGLLVVTGTAQIWHVYVLAFLLGVGTALDNPARQAFVGELVDNGELANAVALNSASFNAARLIGPGVAGVLIGTIGTGPVFLLNAVSFGAPVVALMLLSKPAPAATSTVNGAGAFARLAEGVRYVRGRPDLMLVLLVMFGIGTFGLNFQMTMALMATAIYDKGPHAYGMLGSILAIGSLSGALLAARRTTPRQRLVVGGAIAFGVLEVAAGLMPNYALFAVSLVPIGVLSMTTLTAANGYIQTTVPAHMRGRVLSLYVMILMGGTPAGAPVIGWVAELFGARWSLLGGGILTIACTVLAVLLLARPIGVDLRAVLRQRPVATHTAP